MTIGDLCVYAPKSTIKAGEAVKSGAYMFFTSSSEENKRYSDYQHDCEGIIMGTGGTATLHYYNGKFATSTDCVVLFPSKTVRCKFLYYFLLANMNILEEGFKGAGLKHTNKKYISSIDVPNMPLLEVQDSIVGVLDKIQLVIRNRRDELASLDELVKARFVEMFGDPEFNDKKLKIKPLGSVCSVGSSKRIYQSELTQEGIPFLRISDLVNRIDNVTDSSGIFISGERYNALVQQGFVPIEGDILLTARGTLGLCYIVKEDDKFYFQDGMISWLSNFSASVIPVYIAYLFKTKGFRKQIDEIQAGSTVAYLSIARTKELNVMVPPLELQQQFAEFVERVDKARFAIQKSLNETQLLFDSLMQKYFG